MFYTVIFYSIILRCANALEELYICVYAAWHTGTDRALKDIEVAVY